MVIRIKLRNRFSSSSATAAGLVGCASAVLPTTAQVPDDSPEETALATNTADELAMQSLVGRKRGQCASDPDSDTVRKRPRLASDPGARRRVSFCDPLCTFHRLSRKHKKYVRRANWCSVPGWSPARAAREAREERELEERNAQCPLTVSCSPSGSDDESSMLSDDSDKLACEAGVCLKDKPMAIAVGMLCAPGHCVGVSKDAAVLSSEDTEDAEFYQLVDEIEEELCS